LYLKLFVMKTAELKQKLHDYIDNAEQKKLKAIYTMVESDIDDTYEKWNDEAFIKEMDKRINDLETGKVKGYTWEEVQQRTRKILKNK